MSEHKDRFLAWLERVAEEADEWEDTSPSYDRKPDGDEHWVGAWAANIGSAMWHADSALRGESDESPYIYMCKCQPIGDERIGGNR